MAFATDRDEPLHSLSASPVLLLEYPIPTLASIVVLLSLPILVFAWPPSLRHRPCLVALLVLVLSLFTSLF